MTWYDMQTVLYEYRWQPLLRTYHECHENLLFTTQIIIDIHDITSNLMVIWHTSSNYVGFTNMTPEHAKLPFCP